ncbi:MAG: ORF6N domain-containing protein [Oscillospiraceae bacterium]|nr:ORF6N domain-containing protein [Oscillospiraceae bacterium]
MDNKLINIDDIDIKSLIYTVRGKQVMLDSDVAMLYKYATKEVNQTRKRNIRRFPDNFCFQLTNKELLDLRSQIVTSSLETTDMYGGRRYLPYAYTEQGIAMLSPLLKSEVAIQVSINIMNAFVEMRKFINTNKELFERVITIENKIDAKFLGYDNKFEQIFNALQKDEKFKQKIFFEGQIYDSYKLIIDIIKRAKCKIVIIDNYISDDVLKMLTKKNKDVEVVIITLDMGNVSKLDIQKFNQEYPVLRIARTKKFHDRFIIIDNEELYHCGASIKDLGKKCFAISKMENTEIINIMKNIG